MAAASHDHETTRTLQEQMAFLERELEHHRDQLKNLWDELTEAKRQITRLRKRLERADESE